MASSSPTPSPSPSASPSRPAAAPRPVRHTFAEDALALVSGTLLISLGVALFTTAGLLTGGTAGLAFLVHYGTGLGFGPVFFVFNLPFYWLALQKMGRAFTLKTFAAVALLSALTTLQQHLLSFASLQPVYAAVTGGLVTGTGFLILFRHKCSLGGFGVLALWLQERFGWRAGKVQMGIDCAIVLLALALVEPARVLLSMVGAVALNAVLAINHRPGRYLGF
jgi:uncharacterized membrane-anchored protein YitT (DUF2179 family)